MIDAAARACSGKVGAPFSSPSSRATGAGSKLLVVENGETSGDAPAELAAHADELIRGGRSRKLELDGMTVFGEVYGPPPRLLVYGAVDTAEALCRAAKLLGWTTIVADARAKFATRRADPERGRAPRRVAGGGVRAGRARPLDRRRRPHARRQVRRARAEGGARDGGVLHRRARLPAKSGTAARASRRGRGGRRGVRADRRAVAGSTSAPTRTRRRPCRSSREALAVRAGRSGGPLRTAKQRIHVEVE